MYLFLGRPEKHKYLISGGWAMSFDKDDVDEFFKKNGVHWLVRGHLGKDIKNLDQDLYPGYRFAYGDEARDTTVVYIWSAGNFKGKYHNRSSVLRLSKKGDVVHKHFEVMEPPGGTKTAKSEYRSYLAQNRW